MKKLMMTLMMITLLFGCSSKANQKPQPYEISETQAKMTALNQSQLSEKDFDLISIEKDIEDNKNIYEVKLSNQKNEYTYLIDRNSGEILASKKEEINPPQDDIDKNTTSSEQNQNQSSTNQTNNESVDNELLSKNEVLNLLLKKLPDLNVDMVQMELDDENGHLIYEGEIHHQNKEIDFEINAKTGSFLEWSIEQDND